MEYALIICYNKCVNPLLGQIGGDYQSAVGTDKFGNGAQNFGHMFERVDDRHFAHLFGVDLMEKGVWYIFRHDHSNHLVS